MQCLEQRLSVSPPTFVSEGELRAFLMRGTEQAIRSFPKRFDYRLYEGLERLMVNVPKGFLSGRSFRHLRKLLLAQFFLQNRMEEVLEEDEDDQKHLFLKLFQFPSRVCLALVFHSSYGFQKQQLFHALQMVLPGVQETPGSYYLWHHPEHPFFFCYLEVYKLRGKEFSKSDLLMLEKALWDQLLVVPPLTPALFWPFNEEESFRQVQLLQREIHNGEDMPHVSVHFQEQSPSSLEFLIHLVRPRCKESLNQALKRLPESVQFFCHFLRTNETPLPLEICAFSLKVPPFAFDVRGSINLVYARRYVLKYLERIIGPFRDYNGGLFETQQQHFEMLRLHLSSKIAYFDLFAEKAFYALHPVERRLSLSLEEAYNVFALFSELMQSKKAFEIRTFADSVMILKTNHGSHLRWMSQMCLEYPGISSQAQLTLGSFHYFCLIGSEISKIESMLKMNFSSEKKAKTLYLSFQEGAPLSLNPHHSSGDMRCRLLSKLLFEGLTRLNAEHQPELAGACDYSSKNGLSYTFRLRPCYWSNGEKVTAADYVMSWMNAMKDHVSHPELFFVIKNARKFKEKKCTAKELGLHVIDPETLHIELEWPDPHFLSKLAQPYFFPLFGSMREPKWFNGPYVVREQHKEELLLERNPYFWDGQRPFFEQVKIRWLNDIKEIYELFAQGKIDWIGDPLSKLSPPLIEKLQQEGKLHQKRVNRQFVVCFNAKRCPFNSPLIRRALSLAIDRSLISKEIFPHSIPLDPISPSVEEANVLFEQGLKELQLTRNSFPSLTFSYSHQTGREHLAHFLQECWQKILGIKVQLERVEWNLFRNKLENGLFEITATIQDFIENDSIEFLERIEGESSWNFSQWSHSGYREIVFLAKTERDEKVRRQLIQQAKKILEEETPFTPLFIYTHLFAHHFEFSHYLLDQEGCVDFSWAQSSKQPTGYSRC